MESIDKVKGTFEMKNKDILEIFFVRHAETEYTNIGDRDNCDGELTEKGEMQCVELGKNLKILILTHTLQVHFFVLLRQRQAL